MTWRHFGVFLLVNLAWASNTIVSKFAVSTLGMPPLFYTGARFGLVAAMLAPWLFPLPAHFLRLAVVGLLVGGFNFGLFFTGLQTADASSATIVGQIGVPLTLLLSVGILGESIGWRRGLGIILAIGGAAIVTWDPHGFTMSFGLLMVAASAFCLALGSVLAKQMPHIGPLQFQAWVGLISFVPLAIASGIFEHAELAAAENPGWKLLAATFYSAGVGSVFGFAAYYSLLQKYEANLVVPLTLLTPLMTIGLSMIIFGDTLDLRTLLGAGLALAGVLVIVVRRGSVAPITAFLRTRT